MPKKKRDYAKRNIAYALQCSDKVMSRLLELVAMFEGHPSNYGELLEQIAGMQLLVHQLMEKLCRQLWGKVPANLDRWTGTGREYINRVKAAREAWESEQDDSNGVLREMQTELSLQSGQITEPDDPTNTANPVPTL